MILDWQTIQQRERILKNLCLENDDYPVCWGSDEQSGSQQIK